MGGALFRIFPIVEVFSIRNYAIFTAQSFRADEKNRHGRWSNKLSVMATHPGKASPATKSYNWADRAINIAKYF